MKFQPTIFAFFCALFALSAHAANTSATAGTEAAATGTEHEVSQSSSSSALGIKKFEENTKITDAELKSRAGSLSQFSLKMTLNYYGPTVQNPSIADQPNVDDVKAPSAVGPSGDLGARYRFNPTTTVSMGAGITDKYLFTNKESKFDINSPYASYDKSFRLGGVQMVASPGVTWITASTYKNVGEYGGLTANLYSAYNIGDTPLSIGASTSAAYYFFNRDYQPDFFVTNSRGKQTLVRRDGKTRRVNLGFAPNMKYNVTQKFNVNTSLGFTFFNPRYYEDQTKLNTRTVNQRVGVGYAVTRDIYVNPYIQFYPGQFSWNTATMNLTTVFSVL